uniref:Helicase C-terminal domain-containing protein n=1 Tax=Macrostomum lignano TaxID=282301 RepID=A0A1I8FFJ5_9PLAT
ATSAERASLSPSRRCYSQATLTFVHDARAAGPAPIQAETICARLGPTIRARHALAELDRMILATPKLVDTTRRVGAHRVSGWTCEARTRSLPVVAAPQSPRPHAGAAARLLTLLRCPNCRPLHSDMQQRQRLKSLDRILGQSRLGAAGDDVAARGLDIPGVEHVVHYQ